ncbi:MAG: hypothetical protein IT305_18900 [Chloroflexi bacterium]|nr:hypothetical protein [Chloroflexota bacterium]
MAQVIQERVERDADEIYEAYRTAWRNGDWRAGEALLDRHLGKAVQRQEIEDVTEREIASDDDLQRLDALEAELKRRKAA